VFPRISLKISVLLSTTFVALLVWVFSDAYHTSSLRALFYDNLNQRFEAQSLEQRVRFDRYIKAFSPAVRLYSNSQDAIHYIGSTEWRDNSAELKLHESIPRWLPPHSMMRRFTLPRYAMLVDSSGRIRELYRYKHPMPPEALLAIDPYRLSLTLEQSYLTLFDGMPYLLASEFIGGIKGGPRLLIASPVDEELLIDSQGASSRSSIIALIKEGSERIIVSNHPELIKAGTLISDLKDDYLIAGEGFFDSGSSDILINFISLISNEEVFNQTAAVLNKERRMRALTALAFFLSFGLIIFYIVRRVHQLTSRVVTFSKNMNIEQSEREHRDEICELERRFESLSLAIESETAALEHQASHDPLTGIPNRQYLHDQIQHELIRGRYSHRPFVIMLSDLNQFKEINDTLGHHIGDLILQHASVRLNESIRSDDTVARLGGDEFAMLIPNITMQASEEIARKIVKQFSVPFEIEGHSLNVGISIGIVEYPSHGDDLNILLQRADVAMYNAKNKRLGYTLYKSDEDKYTTGRLELMSDLQRAISDYHLTLYYQPKIDIVTRQIIGAEALLRWNHPERGMIPPDEFIPLAEQTGLIQELTEWVIRESLYQCVAWRDMGFDLSVSINLSVSCIHNTSLVELFEDLVNKLQIAPDKCIIEITENIFMKDMMRVKKVLTTLSDMGLRISIDDFGTGYSSLAYLKELPVHEIKIDRSFVMEMTEDINDAVIVTATIDLAHNLGLSVVAEGVTSLDSLQRLHIAGCDIAQGNYIGEPVNCEAFLALLKKPPSLRIVE